LVSERERREGKGEGGRTQNSSRLGRWASSEAGAESILLWPMSRVVSLVYGREKEGGRESQRRAREERRAEARKLTLCSRPSILVNPLCERYSSSSSVSVSRPSILVRRLPVERGRGGISAELGEGREIELTLDTERP
jgi:hypothetical protein